MEEFPRESPTNVDHWDWLNCSYASLGQHKRLLLPIFEQIAEIYSNAEYKATYLLSLVFIIILGGDNTVHYNFTLWKHPEKKLKIK